MKKTYFTPEMEIMGIETQELLASSFTLNDTTPIDAGESLAPGMESPTDILGLPGFVFE